MTDSHFWSKVDIRGSNDCWEWMRGCSWDGYGAHKVNGKQYAAHRYAWMQTYGDIPPSICVCHHCDNTICVNPSHLFLGTPAENQQDKARKGRVAGERNPRAKITVEQVNEITSRYHAGESTIELAKEFGYTRSHLYKIIGRRAWKRLVKKEA